MQIPNVILRKEGKWFVAKSTLVKVASQGRTEKSALKNIQEALLLYFGDSKRI